MQMGGMLQAISGCGALLMRGRRCGCRRRRCVHNSLLVPTIAIEILKNGGIQTTSRILVGVPELNWSKRGKNSI